MTAPTRDTTKIGAGGVSAPGPGAVPDAREVERAAVELRTRGRTEAQAGRELATRHGDTEAVAEVVSTVYAYTIDEGSPQYDDRAARLLAPRLAPRHRYVIAPGMPEGRWKFYDGERWRDDSARVKLADAIERAALDLNENNSDTDDLGNGRSSGREARKIAAQLSKAGGKAAAIRVLAPHLAIYSDVFDSNPELVALSNGTLRTRGRGRGRIRPHRAEDYITTGLELNYRPETLGRDLDWQSFGLSILSPEVWRWLNLTLARWALHGHAPTFALVMHGPTRTGKTTLSETVLAVLGDLGATGSLAAFTEQTTPGPNSARASLFGPWLVSMSEAGRYDAISSQPFKTYTGGGTSNVEEKYQQQHDAKPTALVVLDTNHLPKVDGSDDAVMRRLWLVPFSRRFYNTGTEAGRAEFEAAVEQGERPGVVDADLGDRLRSRESLEAILAWWIALLRSEPDADPTPPLEVQRATEAWRAQANPLAAFIEGRFEFEPTGEVVLADFADEFRAWLSKFLPDRARDFRDNRQVSAALRDLPSRLRVERVGDANVRTVLGLRRVEGEDS
jgi:putative DNA primase/helicase